METFNCILDGFPTSYKGYPLNTDFKVGILISTLFNEKELDEGEKMLKAFDLLYAEEVPDTLDVAMAGLKWFLSGGRSEWRYADGFEVETSDEPCIDYDADSLDIWGAFWARGINLCTAKMHWFAFISALKNLGDCPLTQKMSYRGINTSKLKGETKKHYEELKREYKIRERVSVEEYEEMMEEKAEHYGSYWANYQRQLNGK